MHMQCASLVPTKDINMTTYLGGSINGGSFLVGDQIAGMVKLSQNKTIGQFLHLRDANWDRYSWRECCGYSAIPSASN